MNEWMLMLEFLEISGIYSKSFVYGAVNKSGSIVFQLASRQANACSSILTSLHVVFSCQLSVIIVIILGAVIICVELLAIRLPLSLTTFLE